MARQPFQVLIFPYLMDKTGCYLYALFCRRDSEAWQGISGGGEDGESPLETARRECQEEAGILRDSAFLQLDSIGSIPVESIVGRLIWGPDIRFVPEYSFGVECLTNSIDLSGEHLEFEWLSYAEAESRVLWESNKAALSELNRRLAANV